MSGALMDGLSVGRPVATQLISHDFICVSRVSGGRRSNGGTAR